MRDFVHLREPTPVLADKLRCLASVRGAGQVLPPGENLVRAVYKAYSLVDTDFIPVHAEERC